MSDNVFREVYDFHRMVKVSRDSSRYKRYDFNQDKKQKKKLREPLVVGEKVLVLAERLKKKDAPGVLYKSTTENVPFFNKNEIFIVLKSILIDEENNSYNYWISKRDENKIIDKIFLREELFALKNQFN